MYCLFYYKRTHKNVRWTPKLYIYMTVRCAESIGGGVMVNQMNEEQKKAAAAATQASRNARKRQIKTHFLTHKTRPMVFRCFFAFYMRREKESKQSAFLCVDFALVLCLTHLLLKRKTISCCCFGWSCARARVCTFFSKLSWFIDEATSTRHDLLLHSNNP